MAESKSKTHKTPDGMIQLSVPEKEFPTSDAVPQGFFSTYLHYAREVTDAPDVLHLGAALAVFAATVSNRAQLEITFPGEKIASFPLHLWVLLVGPSDTHKSSTCYRALRLYQGETGPVDGSQKEVYRWIAQHPSSLFFFSEPTSLVRHQEGGFGPFLCELYDGNDFRRTLTMDLKRIEINIMCPRPSILTCTTPSMLHMMLGRTAWVGGIFGRMLPFYGERKRLNVFPGVRDPKTEQSLQNTLEEVVAALGEQDAADGGFRIGLTRDARQVYEEWTQGLYNSIKCHPAHVHAPFLRLPQHILRVAGLYALSGLFADVDADSMRRATLLGDHAIETFIRIGRMLSPDPVIRTAYMIRSILETAPERRMTLRNLQHYTDKTWKTLRPAVDYLVAANEALVQTEESM